MRYLSLFSGIESASLAWSHLGWECAGFAEIEPFPCKVLAHHYPDVPNLGSVLDITKEQIEALGHIDLVVFGSPCQSLSISGKREGMFNDDGTHTRSGLFFTAVQIADWANARWSVWENVPGAFSSTKGRDFAAVVGVMAGCDFPVPDKGWQTSGVALGNRGLVEWVTIDAQYCRTPEYPRAVPQRRRRVFVVRDTGDWAGRPPLFLDAESVSGNPPPSRRTGQKVADGATSGTCSGKPVFGTLAANCGQKCGDYHVFALAGNTIGRQPKSGGNGMGYDESGACYTLTKTDVHGVCADPSDSNGDGRMAVRRLTPTECESLQAFPLGFTNIPGASDSARYKALGNSMACNVMHFIGQKINFAHWMTS